MSIAYKNEFNEKTLVSLLLVAVGLAISLFIIERRSEKEEYLNKLNKYNDLHDELKDIKPALSLLIESVENGVERLLPKRKDNLQSIEIIKRQLLNPENQFVYMSAIALPKFFHPHEEYGDEIRTIFERDTKIKILLLNPSGDAAQERARREKATNTTKDIELSIKRLQGYIDENKNIEVRLYDFPPILFLLANELSAFIEPYHFGRVYKGDKSNPKNLVKGCIGGHVPILQIRNLGQNDKAYAIFLDHFEYIWEKSSIPVYSGIVFEKIDFNNKIITLKNTHEFTDISLLNWRIDFRYSRLSENKDCNETWDGLYKFDNEEIIIEPQNELTITFLSDLQENKIKESECGISIKASLSQTASSNWSENTEFQLCNKLKAVSRYPPNGFIFKGKINREDKNC